MIDFTNTKRILDRAYSGANGNKISIIYDDNIYMIKFPPSGKDKPTTLSYTNSTISEYIGSLIFNLLGIEAQQVILGKYTVDKKDKIVCACKDFTYNDKRFYDFCSIKNTIIDSESGGRSTELEDIVETIDKQEYVEPISLKDFFWNVFIVDALIGNFDRHNGNWGFLYDIKKEKFQIAPVFDCGSSLLPQADEEVMMKILSDENEMNSRIYNFPTSAIKLNDKKINYYDFISSLEYSDCNDALKRIAPRINLVDIDKLIDNIDCISDLQKEFYKQYIKNRYEKIILNTYKSIE